MLLTTFDTPLLCLCNSWGLLFLLLKQELLLPPLCYLRCKYFNDPKLLRSLKTLSGDLLCPRNRYLNVSGDWLKISLNRKSTRLASRAQSEAGALGEIAEKDPSYPTFFGFIILFEPCVFSERSERAWIRFSFCLSVFGDCLCQKNAINQSDFGLSKMDNQKTLLILCLSSFSTKGLNRSTFKSLIKKNFFLELFQTKYW